MTRRTFVLIVCRTVGVFALFSLCAVLSQVIGVWQMLHGAIDNREGFNITGPGWSAIALGLGIPIAAGICGLRAERIAGRFGFASDGPATPERAVGAIAVCLLAGLALPSCRDLVFAGMLTAGTRLTPSDPSRFLEMLGTILETGTGEVWPLLLELTGLAAISALIIGRVLKLRIPLGELER